MLISSQVPRQVAFYRRPYGDCHLLFRWRSKPGRYNRRISQIPTAYQLRYCHVTARERTHH